MTPTRTRTKPVPLRYILVATIPIALMTFPLQATVFEILRMAEIRLWWLNAIIGLATGLFTGNSGRRLAARWWDTHVERNPEDEL